MKACCFSSRPRMHDIIRIDATAEGRGGSFDHQIRCRNDPFVPLFLYNGESLILQTHQNLFRTVCASIKHRNDPKVFQGLGADRLNAFGKIPFGIENRAGKG